MISHQHYSPFQFRTPKQMAEPHKKVVKEKKQYLAFCAEQKRRGHSLGTTMPLAVAHEVCDLPNAFISPNQPDVMRQAKAVFGEF